MGDKASSQHSFSIKITARLHKKQTVKNRVQQNIITMNRYLTQNTKRQNNSNGQQWIIMGPSFVEGGPIMYRCCPSVHPSVPCLCLEGKRKGLHIGNLVGRVPGTPAPLDQLQGQGVRSQGHGG